ncbi:hypothetical protein [Micromonospora sp. C81]|uniref:hypothetical protein n=1 Tax=Micromonospora sp. C81 TaxID=2824881 RepID=UPI001B369808|nr:hypothetical protein [Micromonospora sp. C81]MBQ1036555.1 hypothetical protein [Micromonospora sp. C81]
MTVIAADVTEQATAGYPSIGRMIMTVGRQRAPSEPQAVMPVAGEWRHMFRASIDSGGGLVDIARIIRLHGEPGQYIQAAAALRQEF